MHQNALAYSPYTTRELEELEKEFVQHINQSPSVLRTPLTSQYINHLGKILSDHSEHHPPYFFIVKSNEINAFAGPGGYIGINSQLILATDNESELAAVMAHEMAHVRLHHLYRMIEHQKQMRIPMLASLLASIALGVINPTLGSGALMATMGGMAQDNINFTRSNEKEADRIGIDTLIKSGFDPRGMANFFKKMQFSSRYYYTDHIPAILRTHPLDDSRIAEAENRFQQLAPKEYLDSPEYALFKESIRVGVSKNSKQLLDYYQSHCKKHDENVACQYGIALTLINLNQYQQAISVLTPLIKKAPDNPYFIIPFAQAELGLKKYDAALQRLNTLWANYPNNYAACFSYAKGLIHSGQSRQAERVLLKGNRQFKHDLPLCELLAQAQAASNRKDYAYFTQAHCELMQGHRKRAVQQLQQANKLKKSDHLIQSRIQAKLDEIKRFDNMQ